MKPEFSREVRLDTLGEGPRTMDIAADEAERAALARRFGLVGIDRLEAQAVLTREGDAVRATGTMRAAVVQACVASGEPLDDRIEETFALRFVPEQDGAPDAEIELDAAALDEVGYAGSAVDLGEAVAETLSLALDPFPRGPNADAALREAGVVGEEEMSPFAKLKGLFGKE